MSDKLLKNGLGYETIPRLLLFMKFYCIVGLSKSMMNSKRSEAIVDKTDERILDLMKGNTRISFQELGDESACQEWQLKASSEA